jgi:hypothetical protein
METPTFTPSPERLAYLEKMQNRIHWFSKDPASRLCQEYWDGWKRALALIVKIEKTGNPLEGE